MADLNKVFLMGRLTFDPELRYTPSGSPVTELRLAVNRGWTDVLQRWAKSARVQKYWEHVKPEFSRRFQRYFDRISTVAEVATATPAHNDDEGAIRNR